jgi:hypothetical protein
MKKVLSVIKNWRLILAFRSQGKEAAKLMSFTYLGGLFPLWGGYLLFKLYHRVPSIENFTDHGEFAIYSAATLAPALYYILKDMKTSTFLYRHFFGLLCVIGLGISVLFYVAVISISVGQIPTTIDFDFLRTVTWILFATSVIISFCVTILDNDRTFRDIKGESRRELNELEQEFDKTQA